MEVRWNIFRAAHVQEAKKVLGVRIKSEKNKSVSGKTLKAVLERRKLKEKIDTDFQINSYYYKVKPSGKVSSKR